MKAVLIATGDRTNTGGAVLGGKNHLESVMLITALNGLICFVIFLLRLGEVLTGALLHASLNIASGVSTTSSTE